MYIKHGLLKYLKNIIPKILDSKRYPRVNSKGLRLNYSQKVQCLSLILKFL